MMAPNKVDWDQIRKWELCVPFPYVIPVSDSKNKNFDEGVHKLSGVTIATGYDLGGKQAKDIDKLDVSAATKTFLKTFIGKRGHEAKNALCNQTSADGKTYNACSKFKYVDPKNHLSSWVLRNPSIAPLSEAELNRLNRSVFATYLSAVSQAWNMRAARIGASSFSDLDASQQTVIFSMHYNMGAIWFKPRLDVRRVIFDAMVAGIWPDVAAYWQQKLSLLPEVARRTQELQLLQKSPDVTATQFQPDTNFCGPSRPGDQNEVLERMITSGYRKPQPPQQPPWSRPTNL